jgi:hypothetical protein
MSDATLVVKDMLALGGRRELRAALMMLCQAARKRDCAAVSVQIAANEHVARALRRTQFFQRGSRPFFAMAGSELAATLKRTRWYLTQADEDV